MDLYSFLYQKIIKIIYLQYEVWLPALLECLSSYKKAKWEARFSAGGSVNEVSEQGTEEDRCVMTSVFSVGTDIAVGLCNV